MSDGEWGPWIEHDGAMLEYGSIPNGATINSDYLGGGRTPGEGAPMSSGHPCWLWRIKTVRTGWFRRERRIICDDPQWAPRLRYRIWRPKSEAMALLRDIASSPERELEDTDG